MAEVIVDTDWIIDPKVKRISDILTAEGKGLIAFRGVDVTVGETQRFVVEVELKGDVETLLDAVHRAGLTVLENAKKAER